MKKIKASALIGLFLMLVATPVYAEGSEKINVPDGYVNSDTKITVTTNETEDLTLKSVRVRSGNGAYGDITKNKYFKVSGAGEVEAEITYEDKDKKEVKRNVKAKIEKFDGVKPEIKASIEGNELLISATDDESGISTINVNNKDYQEETVKINVKELEQTNDYLTVYAKDKAGNVSGTYKIKNPYYVGDTENRQDMSTENPQTTEATQPTEAQATITSHTDDEGRDLSTNVPDTEPMVEQPKTNQTTENATVSNRKAGGKEFYTIKTDSDKIFYLVVDETDTNETAYLLTEVGENDLLNFVNYDGNKVDSGEITVYSIAEEPKAEAEEIADEPEEEPESKTKEETKRSPIAMIIIVVFAGVIAYIIKFKKNTKEDKEDYDDKNDEDDGFIFAPDEESEE